MSTTTPGGKKSLVLNYLVALIIGLLIASNGFLVYQYVQLEKATTNLKSDVVTIIQAYNSLVTTLQQNGIVNKPAAK